MMHDVAMTAMATPARDLVRTTLYYPALYLTGAALGMMLWPRLLLDMMLANRDYDLAFVRMCGLFVLGLAVFVILTIRHRLVVLYPAIIGVRVVFCTGYVILYAQTHDPFFLTTLAVVGVGVVASSIAHALDRRDAVPRAYRPVRVDLEIEANGTKFAALAWGDGPLVLLLHGFPDTAQTWDRIGPAIARAGYRVVAPYLRGYPPSALPARDTDARTLGADIVAIARALSSEPVRVVGHDWGAEAVHAAVAIAPEVFDRVITIAIPHRAGVTITPTLAWRIRHFIGLKLPGAESRFAAHDFAGIEVLWKRWSPTWRYTHDDLETVKNLFAAPGALHAALGYYRAAQLRTPAFLREPIRVPTLAIAGADDPGAPLALFEGARRQFRARYEIATIPGGHFCHRESPDACVDAILRFLGS
jgi:pimeloyl-ACP methyl ester carboxylesterase